MQNKSIPWTVKYSPESMMQSLFLAEQFQQMQSFVKNFKKQKKRAMLLHGPTGTGKTVAVYTLAKEFDYELIEINASDFRNKDTVFSIIGTASKQKSLFGAEKIILIDEIEGLSGSKDRGGVSAIGEIIKTTAFPIFLTCHDATDKRFKAILKIVQPVVFPPLNYLAITGILKQICEKEQIMYEESALKTLARYAAGDIRAAINDLQSLAQERITMEYIDSLGYRNKQESIEQGLLKIFKIKDANLALLAFENVQEDLEQIALWIDENLPKEYTNPVSLASAYNALSRADVFRGRIHRWQHWGFLVYVNALLTAGIAVSKKERNKNQIVYEQTQRFLKLWIAKQRYAKREGIAQKLAAKMHTSSKYATQYIIPYMRYIFQHNKNMADKIAQDFDFDLDEIAWLCG